MSLSLASLQSPNRTRPLIFTIVADGGMGKTTLGSLFPNPVFIRTEDGTQAIAKRQDVALFPVAKTSSEVIEAVNLLATTEHGFKSVIIDSITRLNIMIESEVLASDPRAKGLNQAHGGYGNAFDMVGKYHLSLREACTALVGRGMNVIFLAHASTETIDPPDGDPYTRYSIPMHKKALPHYTNDVDCVAYIKMRTFTSGDGEKKKATTTGERIITAYPTPSHVSKNRLGITSDIIFTEGVNPFAEYLLKE